MDTLFKADIFFFIASIATAVLALLASVVLCYLILAGENLYRLSETLKGGFKESEEFVSELRERLENNIVFRVFFPPVRKKRHKALKENV
ncbi:MAG: hypothetical protein RLZZ347_351 [Candidatus Parcubacteria bacterium]|jgi:hypothetical protein